jgi:hypothetical protein
MRLPGARFEFLHPVESYWSPGALPKHVFDGRFLKPFDAADGLRILRQARAPVDCSTLMLLSA